MTCRLLITIILSLVTTLSTFAATPRSKAKSTRTDYSLGIYSITTANGDGTTTVTWHRPCSSCHGSRICPSCGGSLLCSICLGNGGIISAGYSTYIPCSVCGQTGKCSLCKGSGKCFCTQYTTDGSQISAVQVFDRKGNLIPGRSSMLYDDDPKPGPPHGKGPAHRPPHRGGHHPDTAHDCYKCHGTGVNPHPTSCQPISQMIGHYHSGHGPCPYCHDHHQHWHDKCLH